MELLKRGTVSEQALRSLLWRVTRRRLQDRIERYLALDREDSFGLTYQRLRSRVINRLVRRRLARRLLLGAGSASKRARHEAAVRQLLEISIPAAVTPETAGPDFHCDAGLGGTARWLRAAGYEAHFWPGIDDDELLVKMHGSCSILLTTDRRLMDRAAIGWGTIPALLVPLDPGGKREQFGFVMKQLDLPRRPPRCMACGGILKEVDKQSVRDRIPPKTYQRCDDYLQCTQCGKLFWRGTHWHQIEKLLQAIPARALG